MGSRLATRIVECSLTLGSAPSALPKSPCLNSPKRPAASTVVRLDARRVTPYTPQPIRKAAGFPPGRQSGVYRLAEGTPRRAACVARSKTGRSSVSHARESTVQYSDRSARNAGQPRRWSGSGTTQTAIWRTIATGGSPGRTGSLRPSTTPCSPLREASAPSAVRKRRPCTAALACRTAYASITTIRLDEFAGCSARGATGQSACSGMTPPFCRRPWSTSCITRASKQNRGGRFARPPFKIGGQSIGN